MRRTHPIPLADSMLLDELAESYPGSKSARKKMRFSLQGPGRLHAGREIQLQVTTRSEDGAVVGDPRLGRADDEQRPHVDAIDSELVQSDGLH